jgi:beta-N-acetylhexosaminidase
MKKKFIILFIFIITILTGCSNNKKVSNKDFEKLSIEEKVNYKMDNLSIDEKIAQMLIVYYIGDEYDENLSNIIKEVKPGGFILMSDNITTYDRTLNFVKGMQNDSDIPMIISTDEEGGSVQRIKGIRDISVTDIPYMYYLGQTKDKNLAYKVGEIIANELRTIGVNLTYAPVMDIYSNPNNTVIGKRSFGSDPNTVYDMATSLKNGIEDNLVNTCIKHFPGHGDTETDSHFETPIINKTLDELENSDLLPFIKSINDTNMIMVGHIALPKITNSSIPASLSKEIVTDLLKNKYNYKGLVITDALNMRSLTDNYSDKEIYTMAINAGVDLLLMPNGSKNAIKYIKEAIDDEEIDINTINESVRKILTYKYSNIKENYLDKSYLNKSEYSNVLNQIIINEN